MPQMLPRLLLQALNGFDDERIRTAVIETSRDADQGDEESFLDRG